MSDVLLVEDNDENWDMLSRRLQRRGHQVSRAENGAVAIDLALSTKPDIILMDVNLPVIDGWEAIRRIRANPAGAEVPIVVLTAHAMNTDRVKAQEVGANDYHAKPVELGHLLEQITALTDGQTDTETEAAA